MHTRSYSRSGQVTQGRIQRQKLTTHRQVEAEEQANISDSFNIVSVPTCLVIQVSMREIFLPKPVTKR